MRANKTPTIIAIAKMQAALGLPAGILAGALYAFGGFFYDLFSAGSLNSGTALAFLALIGMPVIFAAAGFLLGLAEGVILKTLPRGLSDKITALLFSSLEKSP